MHMHLISKTIRDHKASSYKEKQKRKNIHVENKEGLNRFNLFVFYYSKSNLNVERCNSYKYKQVKSENYSSFKKML